MLTTDALFARAHNFKRRAGQSDQRDAALCTALADVYELLAEMARADGNFRAFPGDIGVTADPSMAASIQLASA